MEENNNYSEPEVNQNDMEPNIVTPPQQEKSSVVTDNPLRVIDYLLILLIIAIPVINIIALIKWAFNQNINANKRNFSRASLIITMVFVLLFVAASLLFTKAETDPVATADAPIEWAYEEVVIADSYGLLPENLNGRFGDEITREELVQLAVLVYENARGEKVTPAEPNPFSDTDNPYVLKAATLGIASFSPDQTVAFNPSGNVARQDMSVFFLRTIKSLNAKEFDMHTHTEFADQNEIQDWAVEAINFTYNHGIISSHENRIAPLITLSREEAILCAKRLYELAVK